MLVMLTVGLQGYQLLYRTPQSNHLIFAHQLNLSSSHSTIPFIYGLRYSGQFPQTASGTIISENNYTPTCIDLKTPDEVFMDLLSCILNRYSGEVVQHSKLVLSLACLVKALFVLVMSNCCPLGEVATLRP